VPEDIVKQELVAGLIIRDKSILLVHNMKHGRLRVEPPGGKLLPDESHAESVIREVKEELGVKVGSLEFFGTYATDSPEGEFEVHMYRCKTMEGAPRVVEPDKVPGFGWYSLEEVERLTQDGSLVPNMRKALKDLRGYLE
jgi:8-oxo-dGTP pyrophosphatase MutT (NUDIX family)